MYAKSFMKGSILLFLFYWLNKIGNLYVSFKFYNQISTYSDFNCMEFILNALSSFENQVSLFKIIIIIKGFSLPIQKQAMKTA